MEQHLEACGVAADQLHQKGRVLRRCATAGGTHTTLAALPSTCPPQRHWLRHTRSSSPQQLKEQPHLLAALHVFFLCCLPPLAAPCLTCPRNPPSSEQVPPALNRFTRTLDKNMAESLFKLLLKYRPEDKAAKKERLLAAAAAREAGQEADKKKPVSSCCWNESAAGWLLAAMLRGKGMRLASASGENRVVCCHSTRPAVPPTAPDSLHPPPLLQVVVKYGINHVTQLVESGKAQCVGEPTSQRGRGGAGVERREEVGEGGGSFGA